MVTEINGMGNAYGDLQVRNQDDKYYMRVDCEVFDIEWKEISKELYNMLIALNKLQ